MKYFLRSRFDSNELELASAQFEEACRAYLINQRLLALEEKYHLILGNYAELERSLHDLALDELLFGRKEWDEYVTDIQMVNGRLLNLLSSTKAYLDQVPGHLNDIFGPGCAESAAFEQATNREFDGSFEYRVITAIRNHVQHNDFPIRWVQHTGQWETEEQKKILCRNRATALISTKDLIDNKKNRAKTRTELGDRGEEQLDLKVLVRNYLSSMARLHFEVRRYVESVANSNAEVVRKLFSTFEEALGRMPKSLHVVAVDESSIDGEWVPVFTENIDRRLHLIKHCRLMTNMEMHCISGEI